MKKRKRKNPHAVALERLGGLVRNEAKRLANREMGARAAWSKAARRNSRPGATRGVLGPVAARTHRNRNRINPRSVR